MKRPLFLSLFLIVLAGCTWGSHVPAKNPDPNHTHADFAVWIDGKQFDFSVQKYMTGDSSVDHTATETGLKQYLHLHDGNGHVIHRHKPGLTIGDFFGSIGFGMTDKCMKLDDGKSVCDTADKKWRMYADGNEISYDGTYIFKDGEHLLIRYGTDDDSELQKELKTLTDDACRYSKTCPWKGAPPTEHCIADPKVPCVIQ